MQTTALIVLPRLGQKLFKTQSCCTNSIVVCSKNVSGQQTSSASRRLAAHGTIHCSSTLQYQLARHFCAQRHSKVHVAPRRVV